MIEALEKYLKLYEKACAENNSIAVREFELLLGRGFIAGYKAATETKQ